MFKHQNFLKFLIGLVITFLVGSACNSRMSVTPSRQIEQTTTATLTTQPTSSFTLSPSPTISNTSIPTATPTQSPTWTPAFTLSPIQASVQMQEWLQGDPNCLLPCWAGITPDKTAWQEAKQILGAVVNFVSTDESGTCTNNVCNLIEWRSRVGAVVHGYIGSQADGSIYWIIVKVSNPASFYKLDQVLTQYGPPAKVFIFTNTFLAPTSNLSLELTLAYPNHDFIITYALDARKSGENVVSCNRESTSISVSIKPISGIWSDDLIKSEAYAGADLASVNFRPFEEVTDMTIGQFYERFKSVTGDKCISTPAKYWGG